MFNNFFTESAFDLVAPHVKLLEYKRGDAIYKAHDKPHGIYFISKGLVSLTISTSLGKEHLVRLFKTHQFFGHRSLFAEENYHATSTALESTLVYFAPTEKVFEVGLKYPRMALSILKTTAKELRRAEVKLTTLTEHDVTTRIIESVIYLQKLYPEHIWTRKEIAEFCGSTSPTVIKVLSRLESRGLVTQEGRRIHIIDRHKLGQFLDQNEDK